MRWMMLSGYCTVLTWQVTSVPIVMPSNPASLLAVMESGSSSSHHSAGRVMRKPCPVRVSVGANSRLRAHALASVLVLSLGASAVSVNTCVLPVTVSWDRCDRGVFGRWGPGGGTEGLR